jgi:hypothetical protein
MGRGDCTRKRFHNRTPLESAVLIFSTLFHLFSSNHVLTALKTGGTVDNCWAALGQAYGIVILSSTIASCFYHFEGEPSKGLIRFVDYGLAGLWALMDVVLCWMCPTTPVTAKRMAAILALNLFVAELDHVIDHVTLAQIGRRPKKTAPLHKKDDGGSNDEVEKEAEDDEPVLVEEGAQKKSQLSLDTYSALHSAWHLLSASKALFVARMLF